MPGEGAVNATGPGTRSAFPNSRTVGRFGCTPARPANTEAVAPAVAQDDAPGLNGASCSSTCLGGESREARSRGLRNDVVLAEEEVLAPQIAPPVRRAEVGEFVASAVGHSNDVVDRRRAIVER